jgi:methanogenic corrinoid protein MtbC1
MHMERSDEERAQRMAHSEGVKMIPIGDAVRSLQSVYPDVSHSSLRFLEREGLLQPVRTAGGHRLYRERDLDRVRMIKAWQAEHRSLGDIRERLARLDALPAPSELSRRFLDLALAGDGLAAAREVLLADELGVPLVALFDEVLRPALYEVGIGWEHGALSVAQEHETTELARDVVAELALRHARPPRGTQSLVAACVAGEVHDIGLRMVSGVLRERGASIHFLGADVDAVFLTETVLRRKPDAVMLSITSAEHVPALRVTVNVLRQVSLPFASPRIVIGGQAPVREDEFAGTGVTIVRDQSLGRIVEHILDTAPPLSRAPNGTSIASRPRVPGTGSGREEQ